MASPTDPQRRPVQERGVATRDTILVAARGLFGRNGYEATSLEAILAASGVKRGALYHHFASKQAVFDATFERLLAELATQLGEGYDPQADPVECLREGTRGWLTLAAQPEIQRIVLLDAPVVLGGERFRELDDRYFLAGIRRDLERAGAPGGGVTLDVGMLAGLLVAAVNDVALRVTEQGGGEDALARGLAAVDLLIDRLVRGG